MSHQVVLVPDHASRGFLQPIAELLSREQEDFDFRIIPRLTSRRPLQWAGGDIDIAEGMTDVADGKSALGLRNEDLLIRFTGAVLSSRAHELTNLFVAGSSLGEQPPRVAIISSRFIRDELLPADPAYSRQRHALYHLVVCCMLGAFLEMNAHPDRGCLLDFNASTPNIRRKIDIGYSFCDDCLRHVECHPLGTSISIICGVLKASGERAITNAVERAYNVTISNSTVGSVAVGDAAQANGHVASSVSSSGLRGTVVPTHTRTSTQVVDTKVDFAILTALEVERRAVCATFGLRDEHRVKRGARVYWRGRVPLKSGEFYELVVSQCHDMANIDAALLTSDLIDHWSPQAALLVGIAALTRTGAVRLGDVVAGSEVYYYERGKETPQGRKPEPQMASADSTLWGNVIALPEWSVALSTVRPDGTTDQPRPHFGVIASGEKALTDEGARDLIASGHRKILAIEMEGYGFSRAVWQSSERIRHLVIRGICDDGSPGKNDAWHKYAAESAAEFAKHFLRDRPIDPRNPSIT